MRASAARAKGAWPLPSQYFGFVPLRRGGVEHLEDGRLTVLQWGVFTYLLAKADPDTGFLWSCARSICNSTHGLNIRQTQRILADLEFGYDDNGTRTCYIKRFRHPNSSGNYPILINRFDTRSRLRTDADSTLSYLHPVYVSPQMSRYIELSKLIGLSLSKTLEVSPRVALLIGSREVELESEVKKPGRQLPPPDPHSRVENSEKQKSKNDSENRKRYVEVGLLANVAAAVLAENSTGLGEPKERIKNLAAANGWQYTPQMIENAITIAQERAKMSFGASPKSGQNGTHATSSVTPSSPGADDEMTPEEKRSLAAQIRAQADSMGPRHIRRHPK